MCIILSTFQFHLLTLPILISVLQQSTACNSCHSLSRFMLLCLLFTLFYLPELPCIYISSHCAMLSFFNIRSIFSRTPYLIWISYPSSSLRIIIYSKWLLMQGPQNHAFLLTKKKSFSPISYYHESYKLFWLIWTFIPFSA